MKKIKKWVAFCLCGVLLLSLLGGCGGKQPDTDVAGPDAIEPQTTERDKEPLISIPETTEPVTQATEPDTPAVQPVYMEPVTKLQSIKWRTFPQFLSLGDGNVLACRNYFEEGKGIVNYLDIFNVRDDRVLVQGGNDTPRELVEQRFDDGRFLLRDPETNTFYVYDQKLQIVDEFQVSNVEGYFSKDRTNYYYVENGVLYRMDVASGNYGRMALEYDMRLESLIGVHPDRDIVVARFYLSFFNENCGVCAIDCKTGKFLILNETVSHLWFQGDTFYAAVTNDKVYGSDLCYGSLEGGILTKASTALLGSDTVSYTMLSGSGLMVLSTVDENDLSTVVYDLAREGISSRLEQYDYLTSTLNPVYLPDEQLIFGLYPDEYDFSPVVIDPKALKYEKSLSLYAESWPALVDRSIVLNYQSEVEGPQLPQELTALRQRADALEETYGITILMENQTLGMCGSYGAVEADRQLIAGALDVLERELALYPQGFLKQFQNGIGEGGIYLCLTGSISGDLEPVGKARCMGDRYELALDIGSEDLGRTVHHELWHAIEMRLSTDCFDHPQWHAVNPENYVYHGRYDSDYEKLTQWTYPESGEDCYFVDAYARINSGEDRARLMEYVMSTDVEALLRSDVLRQKLQIMSKAIRDHFDTTGWQTPYWERYL